LTEVDHNMALPRRTCLVRSWPTPARPFTRWRLHAPVPLVAIDHIYAGRAWRLVELRRGPNIGSDHYPIIASLARRPDDGLR
jgi:endonuclease/exonuclease/phosphatase (EEP) superfamily protein YafD